MNRKTIASLTLTVVLATVSLPSYAFDFFGLFSKNDLTDMLPYIPDDTAVFVGGVSNEALLNDMEGWLNPTMAQTASNDLSELFGELPDSKGLAFLEAFMVDYYANAAQGLDALYDIYGLKRDGASVFYLDGIYPVMRLALDDVDAFMSNLQKSANATEFELATTPLDDSELTVFELVNEDTLQLNLGLLFDDDILTIGLYRADESKAALAQRFAMEKADSPLTKNDWNALGDSLDLNDMMRGYVNFARLADIFLNSDNRAAQQLAAISPVPLPSENLSASCQAETSALVAGIPRFTFGTQEFSASGELMTMSLASLLEIDYPPVMTELNKLVGFIPDYITSQDALTFGMALGINVDNLVPVLSSLWNQFMQAKFDCDYLQTAQTQLQSANPAMLSMVTGFTKGVKGVSAGIFNINPANDGLNDDLDALVTLSAEDPSLITSLLTTYLPFEPGQTITDGGDPVVLPLPIPVEAFIAQKGNHLVVYSGEAAKAEADKLASEPLTVNGLSALTLDYRNLGELMINSAQSLTALQSDAEGDCTQMYISGLMLKSMDMRLSGRDTLTESGWSSQYRFVMNPLKTVTSTQVDLPGTYVLEYMDYDCSWYESGTETVNADGTGSYTEIEDGGSCPMWRSDYQWDESLGRFRQFNSQNYYRDDCESQWIEDEPFDFDCMITAAEDGQFYCLESYDGEQTLYRYTRQ